jgi:branched-chain amino acid transport system permease protein
MMRLILPYVPALLVLVAGPLAAMLVPSMLVKSLLAQATIYSLYAVGVGMLIRQNGMVSFGHAAFFGLPGYLVGALMPAALMPVEALLVLAALFTGLIAFAMGLVVVRIHGIAFGMLTLAIGQAVYEAATRMRGLTGGHDGMSLKFPRQLFGLSIKVFQQPGSMLIAASVLLAVALALVTWFARSAYGIRTEAIRDNEERARFLGYKTLVPRALVFGLSALVTAASGVLFALYNGFVSPETVHWTASGSALIMTILGGFATAWGPVLGTFVYFFLKEFVGGFTTHWLSIIGACLILVTVAFPTGLAGIIRKRLGTEPESAEASHGRH